MKQKEQMQIHVLPIEDPEHKHTVSTRCKCKPKLSKHDNGVTDVRHRMVGEGPDKWTIEVVRK